MAMVPSVLRVYALCAVLIALTMFAYWPTLDSEFVGYDDDQYVVGNQFVQAGVTLRSIGWAFTTTRAANWHPLTWLSHMIDVELYRLNPVGHHLTNVLLHLANVLLLFAVLCLITGSTWRSGFVAALFAVHPLHVESVAWISERKDVLSTFFWMLVTLAYVRYARKPGVRQYLPVAILYAFGLMAKPMLVSLPLVLLMLDWWPLRRHWRSEVENRKALTFSVISDKLPLFALAAASCAATIYAQRAGGAIASTDIYPIGVRVANGLVSYASYLWKMLWPRNLAVYYPHPGNTLPLWQVAVSAAVLAVISFFAVVLRRTRPYLLVGWLWYLVTLIPVIGLVQVGGQAMADRYTYIPLIGIFIIIAWGLPDLVPGHRTVLIPCAAAVLVVLAVCARIQAGYWHDGVTLFEHSIRSTRPNHVSHLNLAVCLDRKGRYDEAMNHFREALRIRPGTPEIHYNMAITLMNMGRPDDAISHYREAIRLNPRYAEAHYNLGLALDEKGMPGAAIRHYEQALRVQRDFVQARNNLAIAYYSVGNYARAWKEVQRARQYGFEPHPDFISALRARMPEPRGENRP